MPVANDDYARWLLGSVRSGLAAVDAEGRVAALNAEAQRILGCPSGPLEAAFGRDCREVFGGQPTVARLLLDALDGQERPTRTELVLEARDAQPARTIGFTLLPVHGDARVLRGAALLFRDLTPYERMDEQDRLRDRLAALGEMAAGLAHEIRNPLAGMEVLAGLLRRRLANRPEELELATDLSAEVRRLAETVNSSLDFVRPLALRREPADPVKLMEEALARALAGSGPPPRIEREYPEPVPCVHADAAGLRSVLTNLIRNACEAMAGMARPEGHRLRLAVGVEEGLGQARVVRVGAAGFPAGGAVASVPELVWTVSDTGPGIPEELHPRIFYPFFTTKQRGSGVGLAEAQKVVAAHRGQLELETRPGAGASFRVRIPLEPGEGS